MIIECRITLPFGVTHEPRELNGVSHIFEHLLAFFLATNFDCRILKATITFFSIEFDLNINGIEEMGRIEEFLNKMYVDPVFLLYTDINTEKIRVLKEIENNENDIERNLYTSIMNHCLHLYGISTDGNRNVVRELNQKSIYDYCKQRLLSVRLVVNKNKSNYNFCFEPCTIAKDYFILAFSFKNQAYIYCIYSEYNNSKVNKLSKALDENMPDSSVINFPGEITVCYIKSLLNVTDGKDVIKRVLNEFDESEISEVRMKNECVEI